MAMGRITIAVYRPINGREKELDQLVAGHMEVLKQENLVTERRPVVMKAADGTVVEIFEWRSREAIAEAHKNLSVQQLWVKFNDVCEYMAPLGVPEFQNLFAEFEAVN
jgi:hypothetical protein